MRTLTVVENTSLDSVAQAPASPQEDTRDGFSYGGWALNHLASDPEAAARAMSGLTTSALLFGRRTYAQLVGHWLTTTEPNPFTDVLHATPKHVATRDPSCCSR